MLQYTTTWNTISMPKYQNLASIWHPLRNGLEGFLRVGAVPWLTIRSDFHTNKKVLSLYALIFAYIEIHT